MIVLADTSPLNYLVLIGEADLLPRLYGSIHIVAACASELGSPGTPDKVKQWFQNKPDWLLVAAPCDSSDPRLAHLDVGERQTIAVARDMDADLILMDERDGREAAQLCGLKVAGTLRILADGAALGFLDLTDALTRLQSTTFRANPRLIEGLLRGAGNG